MGDFLGENAVKAIITFALGGFVLAVDSFFMGLVVFQGVSGNLGSVLSGFGIAFVGFLLVGIGLWAMVQDAVTAKTE